MVKRNGQLPETHGTWTVNTRAKRGFAELRIALLLPERLGKPGVLLFTKAFENSALALCCHWLLCAPDAPQHPEDERLEC